MSLEISKLKNAKQREGKTIAQCPACAEEGGDEKGEHLVIQPDGRFGCVIHPGSSGREHRRRIFHLAGRSSGSGSGQFQVFPAKRQKIQPTGRFGRVFQTLAHTEKKEHGNSDPVTIRSEKRASDPSDVVSAVSVKGSSNNPSDPSETMPKATAGLSFLPNLKPLIRSLEFTDPNFEEPRNGSLVLGLYRPAACCLINMAHRKVADGLGWLPHKWGHHGDLVCGLLFLCPWGRDGA